MSVIADVLLELPAPKNVVRSMSKKLCFKGPSDTQHGKWVKTMLQSEWQYLYHIY